ncbi:Uu.00g123760.m01.CDS01 [Anthostomella pinea]|uniref:Uu.00g123760.m01.CDS01 n=1 Tax=Anthostomella pinea TaxID=933095 RepID=A0AAI8YHN6_9PEZI|nr:Uu.00g123760.m01.CDS01 [Anthostomella pinea]
MTGYSSAGKIAIQSRTLSILCAYMTGSRFGRVTSTSHRASGHCRTEPSSKSTPPTSCYTDARASNGTDKSRADVIGHAHWVGKSRSTTAAAAPGPPSSTPEYATFSTPVARGGSNQGMDIYSYACL